MSKYNVGDKFVIELGKEVLGHPGQAFKEKKIENLVLGENALCVLPKLDDKYVEEHFGRTKENAYNKGLKEAWELAKKLFAIDDRSVVFDGHVFVEEILRAYTPQEVLAKLKAYEEQKEIKVGDVVRMNGTAHTYVVTAIDSDGIETYYCGVSRNGTWFSQRDVTNTGKHIEVETILEQIGEEKQTSIEDRPKAEYAGFSPHDCESWYKCPVCKKKFGSWSVSKNEVGNEICPHCKTELDGLK